MPQPPTPARAAWGTTTTASTSTAHVLHSLSIPQNAYTAAKTASPTPTSARNATSRAPSETTSQPLASPVLARTAIMIPESKSAKVLIPLSLPILECHASCLTCQTVSTKCLSCKVDTTFRSDHSLVNNTCPCLPHYFEGVNDVNCKGNSSSLIP